MYPTLDLCVRNRPRFEIVHDLLYEDKSGFTARCRLREYLSVELWLCPIVRPRVVILAFGYLGSFCRLPLSLADHSSAPFFSTMLIFCVPEVKQKELGAEAPSAPFSQRSRQTAAPRVCWIVFIWNYPVPVRIKSICPRSLSSSRSKYEKES